MEASRETIGVFVAIVLMVGLTVVAEARGKPVGYLFLTGWISWLEEKWDEKWIVEKYDSV